LNPATQTASALVELPNPEGELRPGLYAEATLLADEARPAPTAERDAHAETPRREAREESTP
jgi:multidrug efflux pump subunit AcrA (membrane-fusion protein)